MKAPSNADSFQVLLLQAADDGRGPVLFGDGYARVRDAVPPFLIGAKFPDVYLEHPLAGKPFLDVTMLYRGLERGMRVMSPAAGEHGALLDWYVEAHESHGDIAWGFELDTSKETLPMAAVHFQPRAHVELVRPFCVVLGKPECADLYLDMAARMPDGWPLSFFGMFRGRADAPMRVCGYLDRVEASNCVEDPRHLATVFDAIGFSAYDDAALAQASAIMGAAPGTVDFQFDVYPDGSLGEAFAIDVQFGIEQPEAVRETFRSGAGAHVMGLLEEWGAADGRWRLGAQAAFARALPVELEGGEPGSFAFTLMPQWAKVRWTNGKLQPAKLYHLARAGLI